MMADVCSRRNQMNADALKARTKEFALRIIKLTSALPNNKACDVLGRQILKSGTSIGANYREAQRASSKRHFISIIEIAQREADETLYWLELLSESGLVKREQLTKLDKEADELLAILTAISRSAKQKH